VGDGTVNKVIEQARSFHHRVADRQAEFSRLEEGQFPDVMFITCSDSRIVPALIMSTRPGELFELRNAGNIVPPYSAMSPSAESGTIEYGLQVLEVSNIIICGHSHCGAVGALARNDNLDNLPAVEAWLHSSGSHTAVTTAGDTTDPALAAAVQQHLLTQIGHLYTHPAVRRRINDDRLRIHAWFYQVDTGAILVLREGSFTPL
jgi:carbonic anhydrase